MADQKYILDGHEPVPVDDLIEWAEWLGQSDRRVAATDIFPGDIWVSTVFLGVDYSIGLGGPPLLFETMAFDKGGEEIDCQRWSTWDQAEAGHKAMVARLASRAAG